MCFALISRSRTNGENSLKETLIVIKEGVRNYDPGSRCRPTISGALKVERWRKSNEIHQKKSTNTCYLKYMVGVIPPVITNVKQRCNIQSKCEPTQRLRRSIVRKRCLISLIPVSKRPPRASKSKNSDSVLPTGSPSHVSYSNSRYKRNFLE
ncbi:UNVERIFIED_CONTAM: hypothetical protein NCL1_19996 [Trichonephila clavipes]